MDERGSQRWKRIEARRALGLVACLALFASFTAPAAAGGLRPDPPPNQQRGPTPDPAPQAAKPTAVTQAASTPPAAAPLPSSTIVSSSTPARQAATPTHRQAPASVPARQPAVRHVSPPPPSPSVSARAARVLRGLTFGRLAAGVRAAHLPSGASSPDEGLLALGGAILLLIVLGEVGVLAASRRLLRRAI